MSFRASLFLGLVGAVLVTATSYALLGYVVFKREQDLGLQRDLVAFRQAVLLSLDLSGAQPGYRPSDEARAVLERYRASTFQVLRDGSVLLTFGNPRSAQAGAWLRDTVSLGNGYQLELALNTVDNRNALAAFGRAALFALILALAFAALLSWLIHPLLLRPLRALQRGVEQLSAQAIPAPVAVPPGNDELSRLAGSFNRMITALHTFIERERSFSRYASHELRTPLSNLRVLSEGARKGILEPEETWPVIETNLLRVEHLLGSLLALTRAPQLDPEPVALEPLVRGYVEGLEGASRQRLRLVRQAAPEVAGNAELLEQLLDNLVQNALKYSDREVLIRLDRGLEGALVSVRDFGPGVPETMLGKLTEPFFRLEQGTRGLGLGLALVEHIVAAHGGTLRFRNLRPGLEVTVALPEAEAAVSPRPSLTGD